MQKRMPQQNKDFAPIGVGIGVFLFSVFCYPLYFYAIALIPDAIVDYLRGPSVPGVFSVRGAILIDYGPTVLMFIVAGLLYLAACFWCPRFRQGVKYGRLALLVPVAVQILGGLYMYL